jgi:hypothetical protein
MRNNIVRIVGPHAVVAKRPERLAGKIQAGYSTVSAALVARHVLENARNVLLRHIALHAAVVGPPGSGLHNQLLGIEIHDVILRSEISQSVEELAAHHIGA